MKYSDVASAHRQLESPTSSAGTRDSLDLRLYFKAHLTDIVRAIGYEQVPLADARERLGKLRDRYGPPVIDVAIEELIDIRSTSNGQVACLKDNVRKIAFGILGNPPADAVVPRVENETAEADASAEPLADDIDGEMDLRDDEPPDDGADDSPGESKSGNDDSPTETISNSAPSLRLVPHGTDDAHGKQVRLSRKEVLVHFEEWLREAKQPFVAVDPAKHMEFAEGKFATLDFILYEEPLNKLVTVRPKLSATQMHDMREWNRIYGSDFYATRVWPVKNHTGWVWVAETIVPANQSQERRGEADKTRIAEKNAVAETATGPAPHKAMDLSHVSHRVDLLQEEMDDLDELLRRTGETQRRLRGDLKAVQDQLRRAVEMNETK